MTTLLQLQTAATSTEILNEGFGYEIGDKGVEATIRFWFSGADLQNFVNVVIGLPAITFTFYGSSISRLIPLAHPYQYNCYAYTARIYPAPDSVSGLDGTGHGIDYTDWFADIGFRTPQYSVDTASPNAFVTEQRSNGVEMTTRPGSAYKFLSDGKRINHDVGIPVITAEYSLTFHQLSSLDDTLYDSLVGCVNSATFYGKPAGTMLYLGASSSGEFTLAGAASFEVTHQFSYKSVPHNNIMRPDGAMFDTPVLISDGTTTMLPSADLNALWDN